MSNASKPDLTPAEARAEIKAFMGEGWTARTEVSLLSPGVWVEARREDAVLLSTNAHPTYRAAVSALKDAWRDAVRPFAERGVIFGMADLHHSADPLLVTKLYEKRIPFLVALSLGEEA